MEKDLAVIVVNYIQFVNVKPAVDELIRQGFCTDFFIPTFAAGDGFDAMTEDLQNILQKEGYPVFRSANDDFYKVLLEPYPCGMPIRHKYLLRYRYTLLSTKPNIVYVPEKYLMYDAILCSGTLESAFLSAYGKTFPVGDLKYEHFTKRKIEREKPTLVYLPTYGDNCSIERILPLLDELKEHYYVISKVHHGTNFLVNEKERAERLRASSDEFYDSHKSLAELLEIADIVLTDASGSVFDALYLGIPVALFCDEINKNRIGGFDTLQYKLFEKGLLPYTNDPEKLLKTLSDAQDPELNAAQRAWAKQTFIYSDHPAKEFAEVVKSYIDGTQDDRYLALHALLKDRFYTLLNENPTLVARAKQLEAENADLVSRNQELSERLAQAEASLRYYESGKLYRLAKKLYHLKNGKDE